MQILLVIECAGVTCALRCVVNNCVLLRLPDDLTVKKKRKKKSPSTRSTPFVDANRSVRSFQLVLCKLSRCRICICRIRDLGEGRLSLNVTGFCLCKNYVEDRARPDFVKTSCVRDNFEEAKVVVRSKLVLVFPVVLGFAGRERLIREIQQRF